MHKEMNTKAIDVLRQLLALTEANKIQWTKLSSDQFEADIPDGDVWCEFLYFSTAGLGGSDLSQTMVRLRFFGVVFDWCIGTEGYCLICEMLSVRDPSWLAWRKQCQEKFDRGVEVLEWLQKL